MGDLSDSAPSVLEGIHPRNRLGSAAKSLRPHSAAPCCAPFRPPRIKVGRLVFYRIDSVRAWLACQLQLATPLAYPLG